MTNATVQPSQNVRADWRKEDCPDWCEDEQCRGQHWSTSHCLPASAGDVFGRRITDLTQRDVPVVTINLRWNEAGREGMELNLCAHRSDSEWADIDFKPFEALDFAYKVMVALSTMVHSGVTFGGLETGALIAELVGLSEGIRRDLMGEAK